MGSLQAAPPENHDDQVCLVKYDNDDLFAEVPKNGQEEKMNRINVVDSGLDEEVSVLSMRNLNWWRLRIKKKLLRWS